MSSGGWTAIGTLLAALAIVANSAASGHIDPLAIGNAVVGLFGVLALIQGAVKHHASEPAAAAHDAPVTQ